MIFASELQRGAAGRILLEAMMPLDDLDVEALVLERRGRLPDELEQDIDDQAQIRGDMRMAV